MKNKSYLKKYKILTFIIILWLYLLVHTIIIIFRYKPVSRVAENINL